METMLGQTLGQYRIVEQIGKGGMATVFKAYQPGLDRYVAIKVLPAYYAHEEGFSERFVREAKAIARLDHPHILPVYDFGQADGLSYIVMKYVAAGTLKDRLGQLLAPQAALGLLKQIGAALDHAHDMGILHRDVKPGNVLIDEKGWTYLSDFGLAKMVEGSVQLTGSGVGIGTPAYMSPEQGQGLAVDGRTDVYSLGVILYEMLTGRVPYEAETPMAVVVKHITGPLPPPRSLNPAISPAVERVVLKALARDPADRYPRAGALVEALEAALSQAGQDRQAPIPVPVPSTQAAPTYSASAPSTTTSSAAMARPAAKHGNTMLLAVAGILGAAVVGAIILAVVVLFALRSANRSSDSQPTPIGDSSLAPQIALAVPTTDTPTAATAQAPQAAAPAAPQATAIAASPTPVPIAQPPAGTDTPVPAATTELTPTPPSTVCYDKAAFVGDVSVPDGTQFKPGAAFNKTWRVQNAGNCTWDSNYQLVFIGGARMDGIDPTSLSQVVPPGGTVDITVPMIAPNATGSYTGRWQMRNAFLGGSFGPAVLIIAIKVDAGPAETPITPTLTPTATPPPPANPDTGYRPVPLFKGLWEQLGSGTGPLGYPTGPAVTGGNYAKQYFEHGFMFWWQSPAPPEPIWVVGMPDLAANSGTLWTRYDNAWNSSLPLFPPGCPQAADPLGPRSGFGLVWCDQAGVKEHLGAPREPEAGSGDIYPKGAVQFFQHGVMLENPRDRQIWALVEGAGWRRVGY